MGSRRSGSFTESHSMTDNAMLKLLRPVLVLSVAAIAVVAATGSSHRAPQKLDRALREFVAAHRTDEVRVIVRARSGAAGAVRDFLRAHDAQLISEQPSLSSMTAQVRV